MSTEKVALKSKVWLSAADGFCGILCGLITGGGFTVFFTKWMGLDTGKASLVWLIFGIWNAINDPLFGFISDRTKSKIGRRLPYIRYGAFFYAVIFILCWIKWPIAGNQWGMFAQMLISLFLFDSLYTAIASALYVMPFEIAISNKARGSILIYKLFFSLLSLGFPLVLMPLIQLEAGEDPKIFQLIMTAIGIVAGLILFFSTFFYSEKGYVKEQKQPGFFTALLTCIKNKAFVIFEVLSFTIIFVQNALMLGVNYYFPEFEVPMTVCYGALVAGAVIGIILWVRKQYQWGVKNCMMIMCLVFSIGCLAMAFFGRNTIAALFGFLTVGFGFSGGMFLIPLMNGDVIDFDESRTGLRREGMYAGVNSLITKPAMSLATSAFLTIITAFGYNKDLALGAQSFQTETGILIAWMLIPALLLIICFFALFFFPLKGESWKQTKEELEQKHQKSEEEYLRQMGFDTNSN